VGESYVACNQVDLKLLAASHFKRANHSLHAVTTRKHSVSTRLGLWAQGNTRDVRPMCEPGLVIFRDGLWYRQGFASRDSETQELNIWIEVRHAWDSCLRDGLRRTDLYLYLCD